MKSDKELIFFGLLVGALIFLVGFASLIPQFTGDSLCTDYSDYVDDCKELCEYYYVTTGWMGTYCCGDDIGEYYVDGECCDTPNCGELTPVAQQVCEDAGFVWMTDSCCGDDENEYYVDGECCSEPNCGDIDYE